MIHLIYFQVLIDLIYSFLKKLLKCNGYVVIESKEYRERIGVLVG